MTAAKGQNVVTVVEINPTHSNVGGMNATGGRVNHLGRATDSIFYAASEFGGLFKSTDAGRTWARLDAHLPTRVSDVKASPGDPNRVIATSVFDGRVDSFAGINVSHDGGATWSKPASARPPAGFCASATSFNEPSAFGIAFDPESPSHVFVGTNCGLARSTDGGVNWTFIRPGIGPAANAVFGVVVHHGGIVDACGRDGHRRSTDGGATWAGARPGGTPLPAGKCTIAASPDESSVLFATAGTKIFESDDGGGSWDTEFVSPREQGRVTFVLTHDRPGRAFDLWFGDVDVFRAGCTTPATGVPGPRCPPSSAWTRAGSGAHADMGEVVFNDPPRFSVPDCLRNCTNARNECRNDCVEFLDSCLSRAGEAGSPTRAQCVAAGARCTNRCTQTFDACNTNCRRPQEGCPVILASDGGTYVNTLTQTPECQTPKWVQSDVTTRGLWLWSLGGADIPGSSRREALYMGAQDDGSFGTLDAGSAAPTWNNADCCDSFDTVADSTQVLNTLCCFGGTRNNRVFRRAPGMNGGNEIPNYPAGDVPAFQFPDAIARFGSNRFALLTSGGVFTTQNITANPITWGRLGSNAPTDACGLWAAGTQNSPTFFAQTGSCSGDSAGALLRYTGTTTTGTWQNVSPPPGTFGVGVFAVDPRNANRLFVSAFGGNGVRMFRSADGGANWTADAALDALMNGGGAFLMQTSSYAQPTLVAFDPNDSNTLLAGAADAGIFLSRDNGANWTTITRNSGDAANPVIPRPRSAYFDRECGRFNIYVGTKGRGAWRISYRDPAAPSVGACQSGCDATITDCQEACAERHTACLDQEGPGSHTPARCSQQLVQCRARCSSDRTRCRQGCADCPQ
ncbi:MAG: hypothetical protein LC800_13485 [Acidobacteria bacterium]|nr:hypothetical protein [Acidobacteriota bacterium]